MQDRRPELRPPNGPTDEGQHRADPVTEDPVGTHVDRCFGGGSR
ncbi:hypothetical protein [Haloarchaeobius salinus]|nr:hypothetical protein [Haloarchaeobius salinus]